MTGSTGNIYTVVITRQPRCDCPHAREGNQCKHVLYVLSRVLHAKWEYVYQLALLSEELREIFRDAPPPASDGDGGGGGDGRRKPVEGDCPICFCEMEASGGEPVVWCRAACGQNIHKACFETWAATKRRQGAGGGANGEVTCPYCRSVWEGDEDMIRTIEKKGKRNAEGYVNVASQLGISRQRGKGRLFPRSASKSLTCPQTIVHIRDGGPDTRLPIEKDTIDDDQTGSGRRWLSPGLDGVFLEFA
jgi:hypothetical protein